ncbi:hypothetical protein D3C78_996150 [compost metagenome]
MAGSGDGQRAVRHRRADRGEIPGARAPRHQRPAATGSGTGHGAGRWRLAGTAGEIRHPWCPRAGAPRRAHRPGRRSAGRSLQRQPGADHRGKPAGGKVAGRSAVRRHHQRRRRSGIPGNPQRRRQHPGAHHPCGGTGAGRAGTDPALRRPLLAHLHPGGDPRRHHHRHPAAAGVRWRLARLGLPRPGAAGDRLPLRAGHLHSRDHRQRPGRSGADGHPDQGRGVPRTRPPADLGGAGQDRHPDRGPATADRLSAAGWNRRRPRTRRQPRGALRSPGIPGRGPRGGSGRHRPARGKRPDCPARPWRAGRDRWRPLLPGQPSSGGGAGTLLGTAGSPPGRSGKPGQDGDRAARRQRPAGAVRGSRCLARNQPRGGRRAA